MFIVAFHDPIDALGWSLHVQLALLEAPWPLDLLQQPQAKVETCPEGKLLFRGLRVRMAINTGVPAEIIVSVAACALLPVDGLGCLPALAYSCGPVRLPLLQLTEADTIQQHTQCKTYQ